MKRKKIAFLASVFCMFVSSVFANTDSGDKVYISKDIIELADEGIYITVEDRAVPIDTIYHDEQGYYLCYEELLEKVHRSTHERCLKCNKYHSRYEGCKKEK